MTVFVQISTQHIIEKGEFCGGISIQASNRS